MIECELLTSRVTSGILLNLPEPQQSNLYEEKFLWKLNEIMFVSMPDTKHLFNECWLLKLLP